MKNSMKAVLVALPVVTASFGLSASAAAPTLFCSGIGESAAAEAAAFPHTVKLVHADGDGKYLGDIAIEIRQGDEIIAETTCPGPWLLARLPAGSYRVESEFGGQTVSQNVRIAADNQAPAEIVMRF